MNKTTFLVVQLRVVLLCFLMLATNLGFGYNLASHSEESKVFTKAADPIPTIDSGGIVTFCDGESVLLSASTAVTYQWYKNDVLLPGETDPTYEAEETGMYSVTVTYDGITEVPSEKIQLRQTNIWTGGANTTDWNTPENWSCGVVPTNLDYIVIANVTKKPFIGEGATATGYALSLDANAELAVANGSTLLITDELNVAPSAVLLLNDGASLVQENDAVNSGDIAVKRYTTPMNRYDFTYWSAPVAGQLLYDLSPGTQFDKYYSYSPALGNWQSHANGAVTMEIGKGYIVRAPQSFSVSDAIPYEEAQFSGVPNNGPITIPVEASTSSWNLIGNPYPSAIDADAFITDTNNSTTIDGTLYFWTHNSAIAAMNYTSNDYAAYNLLGGIGTAPGTGNNEIPQGMIASGQSFFVKALADGSADFNNGMRLIGENYHFYRAAAFAKAPQTIEKHRVWLNLENEQGAFKQTLVGYIAGATNGADRDYDGATFNGNSFIDFYSLANDTHLAIQGRGLPFNASDAIILGYSSTVAMAYTISIGERDGLFENQNIYLLDKTTETLHDLKAAAFAFTTAAGTFNDRFELRFTDSALGINHPENTSLTVISANKTITVQAGQSIESVVIYDLLGRVVATENQIGSNRYTKEMTGGNQVLIVKIKLQDATLVTQKVVID